jgi:hypothetical protein
MSEDVMRLTELIGHGWYPSGSPEPIEPGATVYAINGVTFVREGTQWRVSGPGGDGRMYPWYRVSEMPCVDPTVWPVSGDAQHDQSGSSDR